MAEIGRFLLDLHGQHQQQSLVLPRTHLPCVDRYGRLDKETAAFGRQYDTWRKLLEELQTREREAAQIQAQADFYRYQYDELNGAGLREKEEEEIEEQLAVISSLGKITEESIKSFSNISLYGDENGI